MYKCLWVCLALYQCSFTKLLHPVGTLVILFKAIISVISYPLESVGGLFGGFVA